MVASGRVSPQNISNAQEKSQQVDTSELSNDECTALRNKDVYLTNLHAVSIKVNCDYR